MRGSSLVNSHHRLAIMTDTNLGQAAAFFAPPVFKLDYIPALDRIFGYHHPRVGFTVNASTDLRFLHGHGLDPYDISLLN
jgi:hypothetical protein